MGILHAPSICLVCAMRVDSRAAARTHRGNRHQCLPPWIELEVFIRRLNDRVADIRREQNYFKVQDGS